VPYFDVSTNKFKDSLTVRIKSINPAAEVWYSFANEQEQKQNTKVDVEMYQTQPIVLKNSARVESFASKGNIFSPIVAQWFHKTPSDKSITVLSKVSSMYTAGGPEALIDSIEGTENWRTGEWQSYYDQDFEAIVDLQKTNQVNHLGIHVLQDISPWIMYPKEVIFYTSNDGKNFTEATRVQNKVSKEMGPAQMQELGIDVNLQARYVKVKAISGGSLPAWHESAGNPSHIFIDEIIIR